MTIGWLIALIFIFFVFRKEDVYDHYVSGELSASLNDNDDLLQNCISLLPFFSLSEPHDDDYADADY